MRGVARHFVLVALVLGGSACSPAALTQEEIVPAFIAASQDDARTMHMEWQGTVEQPSFLGEPGDGSATMTATINGVFDFNGPDYAGDMDTVAPGLSGAQRISYAQVGGASFVNYGNGGWMNAGDFGAVPSNFDPMRGLAAADVTYEAADTLDGRPVHRLRVPDPLAVLTSGLFAPLAAGMGGEPILNGEPTYLIYVDANGIPVGARVVIDAGFAIQPDPARPASFKLDFTYAFSLWGEPVTISPPQVTSGGFEDFPQPPPIR